jgi:dienelactone hydrolase
MRRILKRVGSLRAVTFAAVSFVGWSVATDAPPARAESQVAAAPRAASQAAAELPRGVVIESVATLADPQQSYALYLPKDYSPDRRWPILYLFDPRARGRVPVELAREAAERHGFILAGSNVSRNGPWEPQRAAAEAMLLDAAQRLALDPARLYTGGFSGGARVAALVALSSGGQAAGVVLVGAGFPGGRQPEQPVPFACFLTSGDMDFNWPELAELAAALERRGARFRRRTFVGDHLWAPAEVWEEALAWFVALEMLDGRRPRDDRWRARELRRIAQRVRSLENNGELLDAVREARRAAEDFAGVEGADGLDRRAAALAESKEYARAIERERNELERQRRQTEEIFGRLIAIRADPARRSEHLFAALSRVRELAAEVRRLRPGQRGAAGRALAHARAVAFENGETALGESNPALAVAYLEVATTATDEFPYPWFMLARARAAVGDRRGAVAALERAVERGFASRELLDSAAEFESLRDDSRFRRLRDRLSRPESNELHESLPLLGAIARCAPLG